MPKDDTIYLLNIHNVFIHYVTSKYTLKSDYVKKVFRVWCHKLNQHGNNSTDDTVAITYPVINGILKYIFINQNRHILVQISLQFFVMGKTDDDAAQDWRQAMI